MGEWLKPLAGDKKNKGEIKQFAIKQAGDMLDAAGVDLPDGALPLASTEKPEVTIDIVKAVMGPDFIGPEQVAKTYGRKVTEKELAKLLAPLTIEMLARGRELGAILSLRTGRAGDGSPITAKWMHQELEPELDKAGKGKIFYSTGWYCKERFFKQDTPKYDLALAFTTKSVIEGSTNINYLKQTQVLADFVTGKVFKGQTPPLVYQDAIAQFNDRKEELEELLRSDWRKAAAKLSSLTINQLMRRTFPEVVYDSAAYLQSTGTRLLPDRWDWTTSRASDDGLVHFGRSVAFGAYVDGWSPGSSAPDIGVCASWIVSKI